MRGATKAGMKPILASGIEGFVDEPDLVVAETAMVANLKLIEGVVGAFPDDRELLEMAAMARANYAFGFLQDQLEALKLARPDDRPAAQALLRRLLASFRAGRGFAERALALGDGWADTVAGRRLDDLEVDELKAALSTLEAGDAAALFWLAFNWGGALQANLDPAEVTQLPKLEAMAARVLELDEAVFYAIGPNLLVGALHGFRAPALGGDPAKALHHLARAKALGGVTLPDVIAAQFVHAQTDDQAAFESTLRAVLDAPPAPGRALLDAMARRKACRLLAHADTFFLVDAPLAVPEACHAIPHVYPLPAASAGGGAADVQP